MKTEKQEVENMTAVQRIEQRIHALLKQNVDPELADVKSKEIAKKLKNAQKLIPSYDLSENDKTALLLAIISTPAGYSVSSEKTFAHGEKIAQEYLKEEKVGESIIKKVVGCLQVKAGGKKAETLVEEVYEDIQNSIFAGKKYPQRFLPFLQIEDDVNLRNPIEVEIWLKKHSTKLDDISFNTKPAKKKYKKGIKRNIKSIKKIRSKKKKKIAVYEMPLDNSKGVQMMFKTALRNHIDLTSIADNKASIMLSINAIIITIAMPLLIRYMGDNGYLFIPMIVLMLTCVFSIIFAALATRPMKSDGETDVDKVMEKSSTNLFFFGNFYNISLPDYQRGLKKVIRSSEVLERSAINDLYFLGKALGDKFHLLRICYMIFMIGIALSVLSYGVVLAMTAQ